MEPRTTALVITLLALVGALTVLTCYVIAIAMTQGGHP